MEGKEGGVGAPVLEEEEEEEEGMIAWGRVSQGVRLQAGKPWHKA